MKVLVFCCLITLLATAVKSNPVDEVAEDSVDAPQEIEGQGFQNEDYYSDEVELTQDEKERIFGIDIPLCIESTDDKFNLHFSHISDCSKFYLCSFGKAHLMDCPSSPPQYWSVHLDRCDYPKLAKCFPNGEHQFRVRKTRTIKA